jgi:hypothetical protein
VKTSPPDSAVSLPPDILATTEARTLWADLVQLLALFTAVMEGTLGVVTQVEAMAEAVEVMVAAVEAGVETGTQ